MIRTYSELCSFDTFEKRLEYLSLKGEVGQETFGSHRYINQRFYHSNAWKRIKKTIIIRDMGHDLGLPGDEYEIRDRIIIHHMNPIMLLDIIEQSEYLLDPEYLVCVSEQTHNAIHYGVECLRDSYIVTERTKYDTCPWKA